MTSPRAHLAATCLLTSYALHADATYRSWFYKGGGRGVAKDDYTPSPEASTFMDKGILEGLTFEEILELSKYEAKSYTVQLVELERVSV